MLFIEVNWNNLCSGKAERKRCLMSFLAVQFQSEVADQMLHTSWRNLWLSLMVDRLQALTTLPNLWASLGQLGQWKVSKLAILKQAQNYCHSIHCAECNRIKVALWNFLKTIFFVALHCIRASVTWSIRWTKREDRTHTKKANWAPFRTSKHIV